MEKLYTRFRFYERIGPFAIILMLISVQFSFAELINTDHSKENTCLFPSYTTRQSDVTSPKNSDAKFSITNINDATHYEIIEGLTTPFDFKKAIALNPGQNTVEIKNIPNPDKDLVFRIRLYNGSATCKIDQKIIFEHVNFAENRDYAQLEIVQGVDNSTPKLDEIVTFTTVILNKGTIKADDIEVRIISSQTLEVTTFYTEQGSYTSLGNIWKVGSLEGGKAVKLVVRCKVRANGLSYYSSYISAESGLSYTFDQSQSSGNQTTKRSGINCVSVPISIKNNEVYNVVLKNYKGVKWYYKDISGNFSEINKNTNPALAVINPDSSLTVKQGGEFSFSKRVGECNISSCCPVIVESCSGPPIVVDSVYCNTSVDSYNIIVHLENDKFSIIEKVFFAMSNLNFPVLTNYLARINALPLSTSAGYVTSLGNSRYKIENIPAFMPNVTLVSSDLTGQCRNIRIVNAPNCSAKPVGSVILAETVLYMNGGEKAPAFRVVDIPRGLKVEWYEDEIGKKLINKGKKFRPDSAGTYFVALHDPKSLSTGIIKKIEMKLIRAESQGKFTGEKVCDCDNPLLVPHGDLGDLTVANAYPNPVSDMLTVDYRVPKTAARAELYFLNSTGRSIKTLELDRNGSTIKVDTSRWADGTYFYSLIVDSIRMKSQKIVVSHY